MPEGPRWVELTRAVGEINTRLIAGDLENEEIRTHIEMEGSAWFYAAEDPNRIGTIYVLEQDLARAERILEEASAETPAGLEDEVDYDDYDDDAETGPEPGYPILAAGEGGLRWRPLRWAIAAVVVGALLFGFLEGSLRDLLL